MLSLLYHLKWASAQLSAVLCEVIGCVASVFRVLSRCWVRVGFCHWVGSVAGKAEKCQEKKCPGHAL